ncbi:MFS transporter [Aureimonas sp. AU40]|uniref:MFS transporter n=1 Tax=Aureimonas sp. AU40 TaxID=1637747 RepID=UPI000781F486|nr:MFS transporter [Aureimonas sp. AU40]
MPSLPPASPESRRAFDRRMSFVFAGNFVSLGVFYPFFPVWLGYQGLDGDEIGLILAIQIGLRVLVCPPVLRRADRSSDRAHLLIAAGFASLAASCLFFVVDGMAQVLIATLILAAVWCPAIPLSDAIALSGVRRLGSDYGRSRLWGSIAFIAANVAGGALLGRIGHGGFPIVLTLTFLTAALVTLFAPRMGQPRQASPLPLSPTQEPWLPARSLADRFRRLAPAPDLRRLLPLLLAIALIQASHAMLNGFASLQWARLGYSPIEIGVFWAIGVTAEVALFRLAAKPLRRFGVRAFLIAAAVTAAARWSLLSTDLGLIGFAILQTTHALTFAATHVSLQTLIGSSVAENRFGAAQGLSFALQTVLMAGATFGGGLLYKSLEAGAFYAMTALALMALGLLLVAPQPQSAGSGGQTSEPS